MRQYLVSDLLHEGAENGVTLTELVRLTGEDERSIRRRIQTERKAGKLIMSDCKSGYFLPTNSLDIQRFIHSMSRRSREIAAVSRAAEDALLKMTGQEKWGVGNGAEEDVLITSHGHGQIFGYVRKRPGAVFPLGNARR